MSNALLVTAVHVKMKLREPPSASTTTTAVKTSLKNEFASFQSLSRLFGTA